MSKSAFQTLPEDVESRFEATIELRHSSVEFTCRPANDWRGLKASDRARPLSDLGRRLLCLHLTTTTPKGN